MKRIVVIDGKSVFYRGYYAMKGLSLKDGTPTGGVYGFASILLTALEKLKPDNIYVAWDKKGTSTTKRTVLYDGYKAKRKAAPDDFYEQVPMLINLLEAFKIPFYELDDYEADDILGTLAKQAEAQNVETIFVTSDLDMLQVISDQTKLFALKTGFSSIEEYDPKTFMSKYKIRQDQFLDYKALRGDASDNIPGVPGIGEKTAVLLLNSYDTVEGIYDNIDLIKESVRKKLIDGRDLAFLSKKLALIYTDAPIKLDLNQGLVSNIDFDQAIEVLAQLEFNSLRNRLGKILVQKKSISTNQIDLFSKPYLETKELPKTKPFESLDCLNRNDPLLMTFDDKYFYLSNLSTDTVYKADKSNFKSMGLREFYIIALDIKSLLYEIGDIKSNYYLDKLPVRFDAVYDIKQAEFLIDPLIREFGVDKIVCSDHAGIKFIYNQQVEFFESNPKLKKIAYDLDFKLASVLYLIEKRGVRIDKLFFKSMSEKLHKIQSALELEIQDLAGKEFNVHSPIQLSQVLYQDLSLPTKGVKKSKSGFSTGKAELDKLFDKHPIIEKIIELREVSKLKSTYVDALPELTDDSNRLHTTFNQNVTSTGRLSSTNPNLQNIPIRSEMGQEVRRGFVADEGNVLVSADYAQFELRIAALLAADKEMIDVFNSNRDIHQETASKIFQIPSAYVTKEQRRIAKVVNFSVLYGAGPRNLTQTVKGLSFAEAKDLIDKYFEARKPLRDYMDKTLEQARVDGYVETYFGRRRPTPDVNSSNYLVREAAKRASVNMPLQGTGADIMKMAMIEIEISLDKLVPSAQQILQIHDSILVECKAKDGDKVASLLKSTMMNVCNELDINLKVDTKIGKTWYDL